MAQFERYIGIDYSGAETPDSSCDGLRCTWPRGSGEPIQVQPPSSPRLYWARRGLAEWLCKELAANTPTIIGIDHGFSFPIEYFEKYGLPRDWPNFLLDLQKHWPTHEPNVYIDFIRDGHIGRGSKRMGETTWLRLTEQWTATAKSVFLFDVQGSVAKSTFAGLPWLLYLWNWCNRPIHFWPFDGWEVPEGKSVVAEVYPLLWTRRFPRDNRDGDEHAAYATAAWLQRADRDGSLDGFFRPNLTAEEREVGAVEGWILGVV